MSPRQIFSQANTPLKRWLLNFAAKRKGAEVSSGIIRSDSIWDKIFFSRIQVKPKASLASLASALPDHRRVTAQVIFIEQKHLFVISHICRKYLQ